MWPSKKALNNFEEKEIKVGYGWIIIGISVITALVNYGIWYSFPVFYLKILDDLGWGRAETASIFTISSVVYGFGSLFAGFLVDRIGPRKLFPAACCILSIGCIIAGISDRLFEFYITYVLIGLGVICSGYVPITVVLSNWFETKKATAIGIGLMGTVAPPILTVPIQQLIATIGWRLSYIFLGGVEILLIAPLTAIFMQTKQKASKNKQCLNDPFSVSGSSRSSTVRENKYTTIRAKKNAGTSSSVMLTRQFLALSGSILIFGIGCGIIMNHSIAFFVSKGYSEKEAAFAYSLAGFMAVLGRLCGFIADKFGRRVAFTLDTILLILSAIVLMIIAPNQPLIIICAFSVFFGLAYGLFAPAFSACAADLFSGRRFGKTLGILNIGYGIGLGTGAWLGGKLYDQFIRYDVAFALTVPMFVVMCIFFWVACLKKDMHLNVFNIL